MSSDIILVKKLRELTGVGFKDCKDAIDETDAEMQHSDAALVNPSAFTPTKRAKRKFQWVSARQGDNPLDEKQVEETAIRLQGEYTKFKSE